MGRLLIFKELTDEILANPRDVTLFGEGINDCDDDYDLFYHCAEGVQYDKGIVRVYKTLPIFLEPGSLEKLMGHIRRYHADHNNEYAGVCGQKGLGFFGLNHADGGLRVEKLPLHSSVYGA